MRLYTMLMALTKVSGNNEDNICHGLAYSQVAHLCVPIFSYWNESTKTASSVF